MTIVDEKEFRRYAKLSCLFSSSSGVDLLSRMLGDWLDDTSLF